ncbi:hypothetical protein [Micromonospora sp. NPDC048843]|uniref:hypothetical protein n=1 Tax=Micromonospora sp. NPDC048843 TaxID=3155389 RepID=UPI0033E1A70A
MTSDVFDKPRRTAPAETIKQLVNVQLGLAGGAASIGALPLDDLHNRDWGQVVLQAQKLVGPHDFDVQGTYRILGEVFHVVGYDDVRPACDGRS